MNQSSQDVCASTISRIWGYATGMLGICIPLSAATETGAVLPVVVVLGASVSTIGALILIGQQERRGRLTLQTEAQMQRLLERVATLEAIATSDNPELQQRLQALEQSPPSVMAEPRTDSASVQSL